MQGGGVQAPTPPSRYPPRQHYPVSRSQEGGCPHPTSLQAPSQVFTLPTPVGFCNQARNGILGRGRASFPETAECSNHEMHSGELCPFCAENHQTGRWPRSRPLLRTQIWKQAWKTAQEFAHLQDYQQVKLKDLELKELNLWKFVEPL